MQKKIYVDKNDTIAGVIEKVIGVEDKNIILYIPRATKIGASPNNFRLLKRELDSAGKEIEIESVDDNVLEMAKMIGFKSVNPFFKKNHKQISDIISPGEAMVENKYKAEKEIKMQEEEVSVVDDPKPVKRKPRTHHYSRIALSNHHKVLGGIIGGVILVVLFIGLFVLPKARIVASMESINSDLPISFTTGSDVKSSEFTNNTLKVPGIFVEKTSSVSRTYPATGTQTLSSKATGTITISNAYSTSPQGLVTGTRFESPDGKIFRITKSVTVPGRKSATVPSGIIVAVQADVAGADYNIAPAHFTIPGFKGTPKYEGFYGDSASPMSGGAVGMSKVASDSDVVSAKTEIHKSLESELQSEMASSIPNDIKILDGATRFIVTKEDVSKVADADGNFKVTSYGSLQSIGFKEADVRVVLEPYVVNQVKAQLAVEDAKLGVDNSALGVTLKDSSLIYGEPRADFAKKNMSMSLKFHSELRRNLDLDAFRKFVMGKRGSELSKIQLPFPGLQSIKVNLWPFWVLSVPTSSAKVTVDVQ